MIAAVVGCGRWGERVARRLDELDGVLVAALFDTDRSAAERVAASLPDWPNGGRAAALSDFVQYLDVQAPDAIVLAVPPGMREPYVDAVCHQTRVRKQRLRIEKPLGGTLEEAQRIAETCAGAGVDLTIGFTLLHHPLYEAVFDLIAAHCDPPIGLTALRAGRAPRHDAGAMLDLGIHAAAVAAHLGLDHDQTRIVALHAEHAAARETRITFASGEEIVIDELRLEARTPYGVLHVGDAHDALGRDLRAWVDGDHRGTADVALAAQRIASAPHVRLEVAA